MLIIEFDNTESTIFDEIVNILNKGSCFSKQEIYLEARIILPGLEIHPNLRKVLRDNKEVHLTAKEFNLLMLLATNRGHVITYGQIFEEVWKDISVGNESNTISYHICNLRNKLSANSPDTPFSIRCVREVGYCFEVK